MEDVLDFMVDDEPAAPEAPERELEEWEQQAVDDLTQAIAHIYRQQHGAAMRRALDGMQEIATGTDRHMPTL